MVKKIGLGLIILGVILFLATRAAENTIIIQMGIRFFDAISLLPLVVIGTGVIVLCVGLASTAKARFAAKAKARLIEEERKADSKPTLSYSSEYYDPADIRRLLVRLKEQRPDLADALGRCEAQMDVMDDRQAKLKALLDINDADYLRATEELLDEVERFICKNFRKVINRGIVSDSADDAILAQDEEYSTHLELIEATLASNQIELDNIKRFLADLADLVSEQNDNTETTLEAWMQVIRDSLKKEAI